MKAAQAQVFPKGMMRAISSEPLLGEHYPGAHELIFFHFVAV
jgi:hypothetical protein